METREATRKVGRSRARMTNRGRNGYTRGGAKKRSEDRKMKCKNGGKGGKDGRRDSRTRQGKARTGRRWGGASRRYLVAEMGGRSGVVEREIF